MKLLKMSTVGQQNQVTGMLSIIICWSNQSSGTYIAIIQVRIQSYGHILMRLFCTACACPSVSATEVSTGIAKKEPG
jgi:hypothetical protein